MILTLKISSRIDLYAQTHDLHVFVESAARQANVTIGTIKNHAIFPIIPSTETQKFTYDEDNIT